MKHRQALPQICRFRRTVRAVFCCALAVFAVLLPRQEVLCGRFQPANPAEDEFFEDNRQAGSLPRHRPVFSDRSEKVLPKTIRLVSEETAADPWQPPPQTPPPAAFADFPAGEWPQNNFTGAFAPQQFPPNPYPAYPMPGFPVQNVPMQGVPAQGFPAQGGAAMYGYSAEPYPAGMSPYGVIADPYQPVAGYQPAYPFSPPLQTAYPADGQSGYPPDYQSVYQALLLQEIARRQAETPPETKPQKEPEEAGAKQKTADENWTMNRLVPVRVSSPLCETLFACAKTVSPFSSPAGPDKGVGMPLVGKSWLDRPYYFGGFVGQTSGSELVAQMIDQKSGGHGGLLFGYNFSDYWGLESRIHFSAVDIYDTENARKIYEEQYKAAYGENSPVPPLTTRTNELTVLDAAVLYYPLGNAKWRPYFKYGLGIGHETYQTFSSKVSADVVTMPLGGGLRYWWNERIAFQMDLTDNIIFASGMTKTQNNIAFSLGLMYSFGSGGKSRPVYYWPATPSMGSKW
ncbi:MAG: outer membrane beta-barrel protein [Planctomycetaceae bacterium]|jgi:hypothetical protein|nr:outer membrane beta-barrel protein [Planctomycetaceae bacterium]